MQQYSHLPWRPWGSTWRRMWLLPRCVSSGISATAPLLPLLGVVSPRVPLRNPLLNLAYTSTQTGCCCSLAPVRLSPSARAGLRSLPYRLLLRRRRLPATWQQPIWRVDYHLMSDPTTCTGAPHLFKPLHAMLQERSCGYGLASCHSRLQPIGQAAAKHTDFCRVQQKAVTAGALFCIL